MRVAWLAVVVGFLVPVQSVGDAQALQRMVAWERAFAAATEQIGVRDGFLTFFAEDSIQIERGPKVALVPARDALAAQTLPRLPLANRLLWEPYTGHVSSDGTLGWLTGGFVSMNQAEQVPVRNGAYFSVWKRQANGTWRVWLDEGIGLPRIWQGASPFRVAPDPDEGLIGTANETLADVERTVAGDATAWRARLATGVRVHREGMMPIVGRDAVLAWAEKQGPRRYALLRTEEAGSGDLAITVGALDMGGAAKTQGSWVRVWKRDLGGRWRIVFQTESAGA
jgi:ketosteroid isomerase-like protein